MKDYKDEIGKKYNKLTILYPDYKKGKHIYMRCKCDCGNEISARLDCIKSGNTQSCGCFGKEQRFKANFKHGMTFKHRLYNIWQNMKARCYNKNKYCYKNYGARGIFVCDEWKNSFENFYNWAMSNGYKKELELDRIDNDGIYSPNNCKWATHQENNNHTRRTVYIEHNGIKFTITDLCEIYNISRKKIEYRHSVGKSFEELIKA